MPKFESPITSKSFNAPQMKQFEIPDETGYAEEQPLIDFDAIDNMRAERGLPPLDLNTKKAMLANQIQSQKEQMPKPLKFTSTEPEMSTQKLAELENSISVARKDKMAGIERLSVSAKRRIEALCGMSRGTKEVDIDGNKFVVRTLKGKEQRDAIVEASNFDGTPHAAFEIRKQLLGRAIVQVAGTDIELFLGDGSINARLEFIEELEESTLLKLYSEYLNLVQETQNRYFVKTIDEAKEVVDELKK